MVVIKRDEFMQVLNYEGYECTPDDNMEQYQDVEEYLIRMVKNGFGKDPCNFLQAVSLYEKAWNFYEKIGEPNDLRHEPKISFDVMAGGLPIYIFKEENNGNTWRIGLAGANYSQNNA